MGRDLFLVVPAVLTAVSGIALFVMTIRRRRLAAASRPSTTHRGDLRKEADDEKSASDESRADDEGRRLIDDYAIPVSFDSAREEAKEDELDISKICPRCGRRYGAHHRICERDNSELAALN